MIEKMINIFVRLLEKSPGVALAVTAIVLVRFCLKKYPKKYSYLLWMALGIRLLWILPVSFKIPASADLPGKEFWNRAAILSREGSAGIIRNAGSTGGFPIRITAGESPIFALSSITRGQMILLLAALIWVIGMLLFLGYFLTSYRRMKRKVRFAVKVQENIYECDQVKSPFVMGMVEPRIYLPFHLEEEQKKFVIAHEICHIRRKDYLVKSAAFLILGTYWFHPFVWIGYFLMCRDMEMSCDEMAVEKLGKGSRKNYSAALLAFAAEKAPLGNTLGFGEHHASKRIKHILNYQKPGKTARRIVLILCVCLIPILGCEVTMEKEAQIPASKTAIELYEAATPYVGDASAVGNLLNVLREKEIMPKEEIMSIELQTDEEPYGLRLHYLQAPENQGEFISKMHESGFFLWALIGNLERVEWSFPEEEDGQEIILTFYMGKQELNSQGDFKNIKEYGKSPEKLQELMEILETGTHEIPELRNSSISIIGGADGPTSVFLAGKIGDTDAEKNGRDYLTEME